MVVRERRTNKRVPARFKITYIHDEDYIISYTKDISADGMFVYTKNPPNVGEMTKLTFSIGKLKKVSVEAKVIWVNKASLKRDAGMGVQFINPPSGLRKAILEIVNKVAVLPDLPQECGLK